jgi:hypothetical protein
LHRAVGPRLRVRIIALGAFRPPPSSTLGGDAVGDSLAKIRCRTCREKIVAPSAEPALLETRETGVRLARGW